MAFSVKTCPLTLLYAVGHELVAASLIRSTAMVDRSVCLMTSYRFQNLSDMRMDTYGFRVVLEPTDRKGRAGDDGGQLVRL